MASMANRAGAGPEEDGSGTIRGGGAMPAGADGAQRWIVGSPSGILLHLDDETDRFDLVLVDGQGRTALRFEVAEEDAVALWRQLGASTGAPLLLQRADGGLEAAYPQLGRLRLGPSRIRRRHGLLNGRRPRFLVRRKPARLPNRPQVFRERELVSAGL